MTRLRQTASFLQPAAKQPMPVMTWRRSRACEFNLGSRHSSAALPVTPAIVGSTVPAELTQRLFSSAIARKVKDCGSLCRCVGQQDVRHLPVLSMHTPSNEPVECNATV